MIKKVLFVLILVICCMFTGCDKKNKIDYQDKYIEGQDFQYMFLGNTYENGSSMAETKDGYYKLMNSYIYYIEKSTMNAVPLCGKTDCLHENENANHRDTCNAYVPSQDGYLNLYHDMLYYRTLEYDKEERFTYSVFYKISLDGSKRDRVCQVKDENVQLWMLHRGKIFFTTKKNGKDKKEHIVLKSIDLENNNKIENVYFLEDIYSGEVQDLTAYGNYVYLYVNGFNDEIDFENKTQKEWEKKYENRWIAYQLQSGEKKELFLNQKEKNITKRVVQRIVFWQNQIFYSYYDLDEKENKWIYKCELDGSKENKWMELKNSKDTFVADQQYCYIYNTWHDEVANEKERPMMQVYDTSGNLIDSFEISASPYYQFAPGSKQYFWCKYSEETQDSLVYIDKKSIGKLNGNKIDVKLAYTIKHLEDVPTEIE